MDDQLGSIRRAIAEGELLFTLHADEEMMAEKIAPEEVREVLLLGEILEDYADDPRGPSCLVYGRTVRGRDLHVVITRDKVPPRVITVYEPRPPRWLTPRRRGQ